MTKTKKKKTKANQEAVQKPKEAEKTFDFGGIPERDLKKNLGCG